MEAHKFPENLPDDEADFLTDNSREVKQKVIGKIVGVLVGTTGKGTRYACLAIQVAEGQKATDAKTRQAEGVGGRVVYAKKYLTEGSYEGTVAALKHGGLDPSAARRNLSGDAELAKILGEDQAGGATSADLDESATWYAIAKGDLAATGIGSKSLRFNTKEDSFTPSKEGAETIVTIKVDYIEAIPAPLSVADVRSLTSDLRSFRKSAPQKTSSSGTTQAKGGSTSPPPPKDTVNF